MIQKGQYGYINKQKKNYLLKIIVGLIIIITIFIIGLLIFKSKANYLTIISAVTIFPVALWLVRYIVLYKYKTCEYDLYNQMKNKINNQFIISMTDLILTKYQGILSIPLAYIQDGELFTFIDESQNVKLAKEYINNIFVSNQLKVKIHIYNDFDRFINKINNNTQDNNNNNQIYRQLMVYCI